jgi:hypothetical protein
MHGKPGTGEDEYDKQDQKQNHALILSFPAEFKLQFHTLVSAANERFGPVELSRRVSAAAAIAVQRAISIVILRPTAAESPPDLGPTLLRSQGRSGRFPISASHGLSV